MTESEWLNAKNPGPMLEFLSRKSTLRKLRLLASAAALRLWGDSIGEHTRNAIAAVERAADDGRGVENPRGVLGEIRSPTPGTFYNHPRPNTPPFVAVGSVVRPETVVCLVEALMIFNEITADCSGVIAEATVEDAAVVEWNDTLFRVIPVPFLAGAYDCSDHLADLLRDVFGPLPFRPVTVHPDVMAWNDRLVPRLAEGIYDERAFDRMGILADALLDAGCDNENMLSHAREQGSVHNRGCWLIDILLNKG